MLGCWLKLGTGITCFCAFAMSSSVQSHSSMQWIFTQVSNNFGLLRFKQEGTCLPTYYTEQPLEPIFNFDYSLKENIESVDRSARTLQNILNTNLFKKPFVIWNTDCGINNYLNSINNTDEGVANSDYISNIERKNIFPKEQKVNTSSTNICDQGLFDNSLCVRGTKHLNLLDKNRMVTSNTENVYANNLEKKLNELVKANISPPHKGKNKHNRLKDRNRCEINIQNKSKLCKKDSTDLEYKSVNQAIVIKANNKKVVGSIEQEKSDNGVQKQVQLHQSVDLQELLENALWKKCPSETIEANEIYPKNVIATDKTSKNGEGSDTGYSSRCSTPPTPAGSDASSDSGIIESVGNTESLLHNSDPNRISRSQSPSDSSVTSQESYQPPRTRRKYQVNHHQYSQQQNYHHRNYNYYPESYNSYQRHQNSFHRFQGSNQYRNNQSSNYNKKVSPDTSSHESKVIYSFTPSTNTHIFHQRHYDDKSSSYNHNNSPRYYMAYRNRSVASDSHSSMNNQQMRSQNQIYYQVNSQDDVRDLVKFVNHRIDRQITSPAGSFIASRNHPQFRCRMDHMAEATSFPAELLNGSQWDNLSQQVWKMFSQQQQLDKTFRAKMELKDRICQVIWNVLPMCRLFVVGSSLSGFGTNSSDVDMCLMVTPRDLDQRNEAQAVLRLLQRELNNCGFVEKMELITAKVPILKFRDSVTGIDVDLNCNNSVGIRNTHLLNAYSQLDWRVRPLTLVVKLWAQKHCINNAKDMTISSYSLVLMVIHFLQCGTNCPVLPSLHRAYPDKFNSFNHVFKIPVTEKLPLFISNNTQTLGELFFRFLEYYSLKFTYVEYSISIRTGGVIPTEDCRFVRTRKNDIRMWKYLCIEEPFDLTNTARSMYDEEVFEKVRTVFRDSHEALKKSRDLNSVFKI